MKVVIEGTAHFSKEIATPTDGEEVKIEVVGHPDEQLDEGKILLVHADVSLELYASDLRRALRVFED